MKKLLLITILSIFANSQIITVIDGGVKRKIYLPDNNSSIKARMVEKNVNKKELIVAFKKGADIKTFAKKYNLQLKTTLAKKYYIFINNSNLDDSALINKIIANEKYIKTIRPNWGFGFKAI